MFNYCFILPLSSLLHADWKQNSFSLYSFPFPLLSVTTSGRCTSSC